MNRELPDVQAGFRNGFPGGSDGKEFMCSVGHPGSIPGLGRSPREGNSNPLHYSGLENAMDRGAWWAAVHRVTKSQTRLNDFTFTFRRQYDSNIRKPCYRKGISFLRCHSEVSQTGDLKKKKCISLQFWGLEVQDQGFSWIKFFWCLSPWFIDDLLCYRVQTHTADCVKGQ